MDAHGVLHESILEPGFAGFAPQAWLHTLEAVGSDTCLLYLCWGDPNLQTQELAESMGRLPAAAVAGSLGISVAQVNAFNTTKRLVTKDA